jgi:iron-sulfur cluster assembly protein
MGTFHDTKDPLHGITVAAHMGDTVHVGRCHERNDSTVVLLDVDSHSQDDSGQGPDGRTNAEYLERVAKFGVWVKNERLILPASEVEKMIPLSEYFRRPGEPAAKPEAATVETVTPMAKAPKALAVSSTPGDQPVTLTDAACQEVRRLLEAEKSPGQGLRLAVSGGGCSGMVYKVEFDEEKDGDIVVPFDGFQVLLDRKSTIYLRGVILDHENGLGGKGFQFHNPNASNTCGCGESFSV